MLQDKINFKFSTTFCWGCGHHFGEDERKAKMDDGRNLCMECLKDLMEAGKPEKIKAKA